MGDYAKTNPLAKPGTVAALAAIVDYTGMLNNLLGGANAGPGMSSFLAAAGTVFIVDMILKYKHHKGGGSDSLTIGPTLKAGIYSGGLSMVLNMVLQNRIQNQQVISALGTFLGTYWAEDDGSSFY